MLSRSDILRCEDEQIHIPGHIQPLGTLFVIDKNDDEIRYISDNTQEFLREARSLFGKKLFDLFPELRSYVEKFLEQTEQTRKVYFSVSFEKYESTYDVIISSIDSTELIIEILPKQNLVPSREILLQKNSDFVNKSLQGLELQTLYNTTAAYIKEMTGYDRVMVYKFDSDYNGEVVSEAKEDFLDSYLHLHYPAGDIPAQAREMYLKNTIRVIQDVKYQSCQVISKQSKVLDMTLSFLRSVSPIHLEYMQNMGVYASMTISIIIDGRLWGMIACHHTQSHLPSLEVLESCEALAGSVGAMIKLAEEKIYEANQSLFVAKVDTTLFMLRQKRDTEDIAKYIQKNLIYFKEIFECDGFIFSHSSDAYTTGLDLEPKQVDTLLSILKNQNIQNSFCTTSLAQIQGQIEEKILQECAGILYLRLNQKKVFIWTKKEQIRSIDWGGNPTKDPEKVLSPRKSFEKFSQKVVFQSLEWVNYTEENLELLAKKVKDFLYIHESSDTIVRQYDLISKLEYEKSKNYLQLIDMLVDLIERRDTYTAGHTKRVSRLCQLIAKEMNIEEKEIEILGQASKLHDIGKVVIPDTILLKPGKLTDDEYSLIQLHLTTGYEMLSKIEHYKEIAHIMNFHHEKYNGTGYPTGASKEEIPLLSHIMIVADAFDAMTSNRVYQKTKAIKDAFQEILSLSGIWYHPEVVDALQRVYDTDSIILEETSQLPLTDIENQRFAYFFKDQMTSFFNEAYFAMVLHERIKNVKANYFILIEIKNMSQYNDTFGWQKGNLLIKDVASKIEHMPGDFVVFRIFGDDFIVCFEKKAECESFFEEWKNVIFPKVYTLARMIDKAYCEEIIKHST